MSKILGFMFCCEGLLFAVYFVESQEIIGNDPAVNPPPPGNSQVGLHFNFLHSLDGGMAEEEKLLLAAPGLLS